MNGVRHNDLNVESMDDMLRAATELTEKDIAVLKAVATAQKQITIYSLTTTDGTINLPREVWQQLESERFITRLINGNTQLIGTFTISWLWF